MTPIADAPRSLAGIVSLGCAIALATGLFVQHGLGYPPCSLCVLQRVAFIALLLLSTPIAVFDMRPATVRLLTPFVLLAALAGLGVAAHQVWINAFPSGVARCGRGLAGYFEGLPFETVANWVLEAEGDCAKPVRFFGFVTLPQLGLVAFAAIAVLSGRMVLLSRRVPMFASTPPVR
jgi:disulfide bond formation protein DsbB